MPLQFWCGRFRKEAYPPTPGQTHFNSAAENAIGGGEPSQETEFKVNPAFLVDTH